jgi:LysM domain
MNNDRPSRLWIVAVAIVAIIVCLVISALLYSFQRTRNFNTRPLVLIHNPLNRDEIEVGAGAIIHATARSQRGVDRIELWVDNELIAKRDIPNHAASPLTITKGWVPTDVGTHLIIVRAFSADGVEGQSSIGVIAVDSGEVGGAIHTVEDGDSLSSIAEDYGTTPEEIEEINPGMGPGGPAPGGSLEIPDEESLDAGDDPSAGEDASDDGEPPAPESESPSDEGIVEEVADWFGHPAEGMIGLQIEFPEIRTNNGLEELHCYIGFAGAPPIWFPDADGDQSTDESFEIMGVLDEYTSWDVGPFLVGAGSTPVIFWPENEPITFDISCVGVAGGGTEALNLGREEVIIEPFFWNGTLFGRNITGPDGEFGVFYRVIPVGDHPRGVPIYLDPNMTPPINVRIDERRISLRWDYEPEADEEPIDGFRVYLNGNLQWTETADTFEAGLPYEWLNPPCGSTYIFSVTAFRYGFPDGPESIPGITSTHTPAENCTREIQINFLTFETFELGGDGNHEDRDGDIGPPYGSFYANEESVFFSAVGPILMHMEGGLDLARGLHDFTLYDIAVMAADETWGFNGYPSMIVDVPDGGTFEFGFNIMDNDTGLCNSVSRRGCDDLICEGISGIYEDNLNNVLDRYHEGTLESSNGRCAVSYRFGPAFGSPVGTGAEGQEPLPWIEVEDINIDATTGLMEIHVRNTGTATWPWRDLEVQLVTREGSPLTTITWPGYVLEAGQRDVLEDPYLWVEPPYDACVVIDPNDQVLESAERAGTRTHIAVCPQLPDLEIRDVNYNALGSGGRIQVTVRNNGTAAIASRRIEFETLLTDGTPLDLEESFLQFLLEPGEERVFRLRGVSESVRAQMAQGYSVTVNPEASFVESNHFNNTYSIPAAQSLWVYWYGIEAPYSVGGVVEYDLNVYATSGRAVRQIADWHIGQDIDWGSCFDDRYCIRVFDDGEYETRWFEVFGDENLELSLNIDHPGSLTEEMSGVAVFGPDSIWGSHPASNFSCNPIYDGHGDLQSWALGSSSGNNWLIRYNLCRDDSE